MTLQWLHWPSVFHIFGTLGVLWYFVWEWRAASAPDEDERCTQAERDLLAKNTVERVGLKMCCNLGLLNSGPCHQLFLLMV